MRPTTQCQRPVVLRCGPAVEPLRCFLSMRPKSSCPVPRSLRPGGGILVLRLTIAAAAIAGTAILGGCTYYQTAPGVYSTTPPTPPSAFERSRNAALGAFEDQGVAIASADRGAGI